MAVRQDDKNAGSGNDAYDRARETRKRCRNDVKVLVFGKSNKNDQKMYNELS
jgi:hypothetical protein